jgi:hypothetical protein
VGRDRHKPGVPETTIVPFHETIPDVTAVSVEVHMGLRRANGIRRCRDPDSHVMGPFFNVRYG